MGRRSVIPCQPYSHEVQQPSDTELYSPRHAHPPLGSHSHPSRDRRYRLQAEVAGQEIERLEVEARPPTADLVATLKASLERKGLAKAAPTKADQKTPSAKHPARRRRAS